jgi:hypothetical protein
VSIGGSPGSPTPTIAGQLALARALSEATRSLKHLRVTRGASRRTQRRMASTAALVLAAAALLTARPAAAQCVVQFVPETSPLPPIVGGSACIGLLPVPGAEEPLAFVGAADGNVYDLGGDPNTSGLSDVGTFATPTFGDLDGDRDRDALVGNGAGDLVFFRNTSTEGLPAFAASALNPFGLQPVDGRSRPALVDIDGDGDLDAFVGDAAGDVTCFGNGGLPTAPAFVKMGRNPFGLQNVGLVASPTFADVDLDGDYDAVIGNQNGDTVFFENTGSRTAPLFAAPLVNALGLPKVDAESCPSLARIDGDGDVDAVIGGADGGFLFVENRFSCPPNFFGPAGGPFGLPNVEINPDPVFVDIDGDGDADAFIGLDRGTDSVVFCENDGELNQPHFAAPLVNPFGLPAGLEITSPAFADLDGDGDLDAFIGEAYGAVYQFTNTGDAHAPAFAVPPVSNPFGPTGDLLAKPTFGDLDGDGDLDVLVGSKAGNFYFFANTGSATGTAPDGTVFTEYLATLNSMGVGGHHDWRLPTSASIASSGALHAAELEGIVDCSHTPCIDPAFGPTAAALYWTSATVPEVPSAASTVHFGNGVESFDGKNHAFAVRAVRGGGIPPRPRFWDTGLTVQDRVTELEWVKSDDGGGLTNVDDLFTWGLTQSSADGTLATAYLTNLNDAAYAGHSDWRLPTSAGNGAQPVQPAELESILDCSYTPCIHPLFGPGQIGYWSSTIDLSLPSTVLTGSLTTGGINHLNRAKEFFARAVRNVPRAISGYEDQGLTIFDYQTGLEWVKTDDAGGLTDKDRTFTWSASGVAADGTVFTEYLAGLNAAKYAGHDDWRLPTNTLPNLPLGQRPELSGIVDCAFTPCIDPTFGPMGGSIYWSSTTNPHADEFALMTVFDTGVSSDIAKTTAAHARAVRHPTAQVPARFVDGGFTVIDQATNLEWAKSDDAGGITDKDRLFTWSATGTAADGTAFTQYVAGLNAANYGGHSDWRLPSSFAGYNDGPLQAGELESIADCSYPKCLHPLFGPFAGGTYWTASTNPDTPTSAFALSFVDGGNAGTVLADGKGVSKPVRAVRNRE